MHLALSMGQLTSSINPALSRTAQVLTRSRKNVVHRSHEVCHKAHDATVGQLQSSVWTMLSTVIPDDAYDWEGDMFENDFSPSELTGISAQLRSGSLGEGGE